MSEIIGVRPWWECPDPLLFYKSTPDHQEALARDEARARELGLTVRVQRGDYESALYFTGPDEAREAFGREVERRWQ